MFDTIEALLALEVHKTISRAATKLGLTQSAVSKRIQTLSATLGKPLVEASGRGVTLTPYAMQFIERIRPNFLHLREALTEELSEGRRQLPVAITGALMLSWGHTVLRQVRKDNPNIRFSFHTYASPYAIADVHSGESMCAIIHGSSELSPTLTAKFITESEFVILPAGEKPFRLHRGDTLHLHTIEANSEAWSVMNRRLQRSAVKWGIDIRMSNTARNFMSVTQLSRAGFGHGLVPRNLAISMGVPSSKLMKLPGEGIKIPISLVGRKTVLDRPIVQQFYESLCKHAPKP